MLNMTAVQMYFLNVIVLREHFLSMHFGVGDLPELSAGDGQNALERGEVRICRSRNIRPLGCLNAGAEKCGGHSCLSTRSS